MPTLKLTLCCLLMVTSTLTMARSAVLPTRSTTAKLITVSASSVDSNKADRKSCQSHDDCNCAFGVGVCFQGSCTCIWGVSNPGSLKEAEISALMARHSDRTSVSTANVDGDV